MGYGGVYSPVDPRAANNQDYHYYDEDYDEDYGSRSGPGDHQYHDYNENPYGRVDHHSASDYSDFNSYDPYKYYAAAYASPYYNNGHGRGSEEANYNFYYKK